WLIRAWLTSPPDKVADTGRPDGGRSGPPHRRPVAHRWPPVTHQQERQLKRPPPRRLDGIRSDAEGAGSALPGGTRHHAVGDPEGVEHVRLRQARDAGSDAFARHVRVLEELQRDGPAIGIGWGALALTGDPP